jgi:hypothetical protein
MGSSAKLTSVNYWQLEVGERGRNRTFNLLIKSQLLCQLSYAPRSGEAVQEGRRWLDLAKLQRRAPQAVSKQTTIDTNLPCHRLATCWNYSPGTTHSNSTMTEILLATFAHPRCLASTTIDEPGFSIAAGRTSPGSAPPIGRRSIVPITGASVRFW